MLKALISLSFLLLLSLACETPTSSVFATGLSSPTFTVSDGQTIYIGQRNGLIYTDTVNPDGSRDIAIDLRSRVGTSGESGLMSMVFAPDYVESGVWYAYYTSPSNVSTISRFVDMDINSEDVVFELQQTNADHKGGTIAFSPLDGLLYLALGENVQPAQAQNPDSYLGKIIRFDVTDPNETLEVYASGFRNPFRMSFDSQGDIWIGDVGAANREEINKIPAGTPPGLNFGWPAHEGTRCHLPTSSYPCEDPNNPNRYTFPVHEYTHSEGCSVTGGVVSRGGIPWLNGSYVFSDWCSGTVWTLTTDTFKRVNITNWTGTMGSVVHINEIGSKLFFTRILQNRVDVVQ